MTKRFHALAKSNIEKEFKISTSLVNIKIEPVYENGLEFSGELYLSGTVNDNDTDENTIKTILQEYLKDIVVRKIEFITPSPISIFSYRKTG